MTTLLATLPTTLPATLVEADAVQFARDFIRLLHHSGDSPFSSEAVSNLVQPILTGMLHSADGRFGVIDLARAGDPDAIAILKDLALELRSRHAMVPDELDNWISEQLRNPTKPKREGGPKRITKLPRDIGVAVVVAALVDRFGLKPTGRSPHRRSACAVVADALSEIGQAIGYKAVETIWQRYGRAMPTQPGWSRGLLAPS
jgi:hypothetical protein